MTKLLSVDFQPPTMKERCRSPNCGEQEQTYASVGRLDVERIISRSDSRDGHGDDPDTRPD